VSTEDAQKYTKTATSDNVDILWLKHDSKKVAAELQKETGVDASSVQYSDIATKGLVATPDADKFCTETADLSKNTPVVIGTTGLYPYSKLMGQIVPGDQGGSALAARLEKFMGDQLRGTGGSCTVEVEYPCVSSSAPGPGPATGCPAISECTTSMEGVCSWTPGVGGGAGGFDCAKCIPSAGAATAAAAKAKEAAAAITAAQATANPGWKDSWNPPWSGSPQSPSGACSKWIGNSDWGALAGGHTARESCGSAFARKSCSGTCWPHTKGCKADLWDAPFDQSSSDACSKWIHNADWGALAGGHTARESCASPWALENCASTCRDYIGGYTVL